MSQVSKEKISDERPFSQLTESHKSVPIHPESFQIIKSTELSEKHPDSKIRNSEFKSSEAVSRMTHLSYLPKGKVTGFSSGTEPPTSPFISSED